MKTWIIFLPLLLGGCEILKFGWLETFIQDQEFGSEGRAEAPDRGEPPSPPDRPDD